MSIGIRDELPRPARISNLDPRPFGQPPPPSQSFPLCEECPAKDACQSVGNFRKTCPPHQKPAGPNAEDPNKCVVGTNLLLFELVKAMKLK